MMTEIRIAASRLPLLLASCLPLIGPAHGQDVYDFATPTESGYQCTIELIDEPTLSSSEGGLITEIFSEGSEVKEGDIVAATDDEDALLMREAAWFQWQSTMKDVSSDIKVRYSDAQAKVSEAAYRLVEEANQRAEKAIPKAEIDRRKWEWQAGLLQVENTEHERTVQRITAQQGRIRIQAGRSRRDAASHPVPAQRHRGGTPEKGRRIRAARR